MQITDSNNIFKNEDSEYSIDELDNMEGDMKLYRWMCIGLIIVWALSLI
jgi:hypothetical protein